MIGWFLCRVLGSHDVLRGVGVNGVWWATCKRPGCDW